MRNIYIHYGHKRFDINKFEPIKNGCWVKPYGGFWASNVNAVYGWKDWCKDEDFRDCDEDNSFKFVLSEKAKIIVINSLEDLLKLPMEKGLGSGKLLGNYAYLDFEQILRDGYDALEVNISKDNRLYWALYGWDCDSLLVLNKNIIKEI